MRGEMPPLLEDGLFWYEDTLASRVVEGGIAEITPSGNLRKLSVVASEDGGPGDHRERNFKDREVGRLEMTLLMDMGNSRVILYSQSIGQRWKCRHEEVEGI